ncbi:DUF2306 domain-containing protein [Halorientalis pallida]|uniref:DUF2306 domain-containing protein n=1 Tax=Halorientalis pallida TaxID=2479928 RepID=A0A498KX37_9EURY|nr:DUF2306 domain-containing protein [Halorientalis pallida]RXK50180.1 hypothetical protein EAF64_06355 [Halorientalis pallida]
MTLAETATLGSHIVAGFLALCAGLGALLTENGGQRHRQFGRVYVGAMAFVSGSALLLFALAPTQNRQFLALIAVFSFYFVFSGYRVLSRKRPADDPVLVDWVAVGLLCVAGLGLLVMGGLGLRGGSSFGTVLVVFGGISVGFGVRDVGLFRTDAAEPRAWFYEHLTRMGAGYIATVTAFSTVNFVFLPTVARWLWPTLLGTPVIFLAVQRYENQFGTADG